jgi:hypothetical protein
MVLPGVIIAANSNSPSCQFGADSSSGTRQILDIFRQRPDNLICRNQTIMQGIPLLEMEP